MSIIIILAALALALVMFIAYLVSRVMLADEAQIVADSEGEPHVLPTLTSSLDARLFTARPMRAVVAPTPTQIIEIQDEAIRLKAIRQTELNRVALRSTLGVDKATDRLPAVTPNRRAVIEAQPTIILDSPDEIAPMIPPLADTLWARDTQVDASPYGQGRDPKTGRKRGANGRFIRE